MSTANFSTVLNLRVAFASVGNRVWMYACTCTRRCQKCANKRGQGACNTYLHAIPYGSECNTEIRTQLKFAVN